jgi:hypothetical protein
MRWALVVWDVVAVLLWGRVGWRAVRRPAARYEARWFGKLSSISAVRFVWVNFAHCFVPVGALALMWRWHRRRHDTPTLPMADHWPGHA